MIDFAWLVWNSLIYGAVLSLLLSVVILGSVFFNPEIWVSDYPPDIRSKFGPIREKARKQRTVVSIFFLLILFGLLSLSILQIYLASAGRPAFNQVF